ncbi:MAG: DUF4824 family protein [Desulfobulbaceae bacterium]|nr:MAG: DUF4824 family protein [Desulfobulbaceae bacterium]
MRTMTARGLFGLALAVLLAANIVVLAGVAANRRGEPEATLVLSERELQLPYRTHRENSGLALQMIWRTLPREREDDGYSYDSRSPAWLDADKLRELGFDPADYVDDQAKVGRFKEPIPRQVLTVLENDGEAHREAIRRAEAALAADEARWRAKPDDKLLKERFDEAAKRLKRERITASRLFAVDAGLDMASLRAQYSDRTRFLIVRGQIKPYHRPAGRSDAGGYLTGLAIENIHVPLHQRQVFDALQAQDQSRRDEFAAPRYEVELAWGRRLEPWIVEAAALAGQ